MADGTNENAANQEVPLSNEALLIRETLVYSLLQPYPESYEQERRRLFQNFQIVGNLFPTREAIQSGPAARVHSMSMNAPLAARYLFSLRHPGVTNSQGNFLDEPLSRFQDGGVPELEQMQRALSCMSREDMQQILAYASKYVKTEE